MYRGLNDMLSSIVCMIIDTGMIWSFITTVILPLGGIIGFIYMFLMNRRVIPLIEMAERLSKQWGSMMTDKRETKRENQRLTEDQKSSRSKIAKVIKSRVPFDLLKNHTESEIIAMLSDRDLMQGALWLGKSGEWIFSKLVNTIYPSDEEKKAAGLDNIPTIG